MSFLGRLFGAGAAGESRPSGPPLRVAEVEAALAPLQPLVAADGGRLTLVGVEGGRVTLRLDRACAHCSARDLTVRGALEPRLRAALPWVEEIAVD